MKYQTVWFRKGKAFLPTIGTPPSGMFFEVEPVTVLEPTVDSIEEALRGALQRPAVRVSERSRFDSTWPKESVVQARAGFSSWKAFAKAALSIAVMEAPDCWHISVGEGASPDTVEDVRLPLASSPRDLAKAILEIAGRRPLWRS
jgi:hypothetical protein